MTVLKNRRNDAKRNERTRTFKRQQVFAIVLCKTFSEDMWKQIFNLKEWKNIQQFRTYVSPITDTFRQIYTDVSRCENKQPYNRRTKLCINMHNSAKLRCGKLGGKCGKAHGIVGETKFFTRYRLYMERQYTLRIHFYDMLRAGTLKSSVKWIGNVISTYTKKACVFRQNKRPAEASL